MPWRDEYMQPASFRGAEFVMDVSEVGPAGRRYAEHEFFGTDDDFNEDLGQRSTRFAITAMVVGTEFMRDARVLESALRDPPQPGDTLVHPIYGPIPCICLEYTRRDERTVLGMATFRILFKRVPASVTFPEEGVDFESRVEDSQAELRTAGIAALTDAIEAALVPEFVREATADAVKLVANTINALDVFNGPQAKVVALTDSITNMLNNAASLAAAPATLAITVWDAVDLIADAAGNVADSLFAYEALLEMDPVVTPGSTSLATTATENARLVVEGAQWAAIPEAILAAQDVTWGSLQEVTDRRGNLEDHVERLQEQAPDDVFMVLEDLAADLRLSVPAPGTTLPQVRSFRLLRSMPALVLAYRLYDDVTRETDLLERNTISHPAFLPAGSDLEVLSATRS